MTTKALHGGLLCSGLAALLLATSPAPAADAVADFYKGKRVTIVVGSAPGGGYDIYARTVAAHIGKYIPGNPAMIVQNQPGAGSMVATNSVYSNRAQDGTVIVGMQAGAIFDQIMGNPAAKFEATKFQWLANLNSETSIAITWHTNKVKTFEDLLKHEVVFGTSGPNTTEQNSSLLINLFGAKIKQVPGYESVTRMYKPMEQGEIEGMTTLWQGIPARYPQWVKEKKLNYLVFMATRKTADLPQVPLFEEFLTPKYLKPEYSKEEAMGIMRFLSSQQEMARPYAFGPGVPADRVAALRQAFIDLAKDETYLQEGIKAKRPIDFTPGVEIQALLDQVSKTPKTTIAKISELTKLVKR